MSHRHSSRNRREDRHLCGSCQQRKAKYQYRGHIRADRQHVLCFQCFRAMRERMRAGQLSRLPFDSAVDFLGGAARLGTAPSASLTARQREHRQRMLDYLRSQVAEHC